jgi:hypothetical protein
MFHILQVFSVLCCKSFEKNISEIYCNKCFVWMLHIFHTYVTSILSECCICFTHMLQLYFQMFHLCPIYVASKCFMLQVFHGAGWMIGAQPGCLRWGRGRAGGGWGCSELGASSRVPPTQRERRESGGRSRCACKVGARRSGLRDCPYPDARSNELVQLEMHVYLFTILYDYFIILCNFHMLMVYFFTTKLLVQ